MAESKVERKGSSTAGYTCFSRACAAREKDARFRGPDHLAEIFLPPFAWVLLNVPLLRKWCVHKMFPPGMHEYLLARTAVFDAAFVDALERDFSQIVLLGSGMDTRAWRFQDRNRGTKVFDLDIGATQRYKRKLLGRKKVALPETLAFAPIDFNKECLADALAPAGYHEGRQTLFLWEGVTMYLGAEAVDSTLAFIRSSAAGGSVVVFDYVRASVLRRMGTLYGEKEAYEMVARADEEWKFGIEDGAIAAFLTKRDFAMLSHYMPSDLEAAYLMAEVGPKFGRINETHCIVIAGI
ncbi:MAG: class I SAM-dependent methyltransferase [Anaerolineae bacterium]|nr:class I SAM-dependent methyltransferase [Anaerolineae bacterium]